MEIYLTYDSHVEDWRGHVLDHRIFGYGQNRDIVSWMDETLNANKHFGLLDVSPTNAAMILCQFDPLKQSIEDAQSSATDATKPIDLKLLIEHFEALSRAKKECRTLLEWWRIARNAKLKYHPWVDAYIQAAQMDQQPVPAKNGAVTRWTPKFTNEVRAYREDHTEAQTAEKFDVSGSLIRRKLKATSASKSKASPFPGLVHRSK